MSDTELTLDSESRIKIITEIFTNLLVEAGAGSGKTSMLVNRMVAMVESGIPIEKICAITFTKAAANEFYERFQKALAERANPDIEYEAKEYAGELPAPTVETRARCEVALRNIDLCFMGTIDSFCYMVLSEHPMEAGIPSNTTILMDEDIKALYRQEYVKICQGVYGKDLAQLAANFRCLHSAPEEVFLKLITMLMNNRNVHFNYTETKNLDIDKSFEQDREALIRILNVIVRNKHIIYDGNEASAATVDVIDDAANAVRRKWSLHYSNVLYSLKSIEKLQLHKTAPDAGIDVTEDLFEEGKKAIKLTLAADNGTLTRLYNLQYNGSMTFVTKCVPIMEKAIRDKGAISFFDCLFYLRNMLLKDAKKDGKLTEYIYNRHSYFLIDEFQDTNPLQSEVFFFLTAKNHNPSWEKCVPRPGSLFIVGDPKQSIYRFRGADVGAFLYVKSLFTGEVGEVLTLSRNFRSTTKMCDYFNKSFTKMLPEETSSQSKFEEIPLPEDTWEDEFQGIYKYDCYTGTAEADFPELTDTLQVGKIITGLVGNDKYLIKAKDEKELRHIKYSDFMLISKGKKLLSDFMSYFETLGIPYKVEGKVPFYDCPALAEIYNIYAAIVDDKNQIALYAALTGKLFNISTDELLVYRDHQNVLSLYAAEPNDEHGSEEDAVQRVYSAIKMLKAFSFKAQTYSPAALFDEIMNHFKLFEKVSAKNFEVVYYALELLREAEKTGVVVSIKDAAEYIKGLLDGSSDIERCLSLNKEENVVHMANLHKVKGLEAPIIILTYGNERARGNDYRIEHISPMSEGYIFCVSKGGDSNGNYISTAQFKDENEIEKIEGKNEQTRLVYVGATRARNALIICNSMQKQKDSYRQNSCWKLLLDGVKDLFEELELKTSLEKTSGVAIAAEKLYEEATSTCALNNRLGEEPSYILMRPSLVMTSKMTDELPDSVEPMRVTEEIAVSHSPLHKFPTMLGTMTHKLMEMFVNSKGNVKVEAAVKEILSEFLAEDTKPFEKDFSEALIQVGNTMLGAGYKQENGVSEKLLGELFSADEVYCEVPFCYTAEVGAGRELWNGVMDVIYSKDGKWHIIDYKTNADGTDLDTKYAAQLSAYKVAFKLMTGEEADAFTYHIDV